MLITGAHSLFSVSHHCVISHLTSGGIGYVWTTNRNNPKKKLIPKIIDILCILSLKKNRSFVVNVHPRGDVSGCLMSKYHKIGF